MLKWLERQMPHASVCPNDPIFNAEIRSLRWGQSRRDLERYTLTIVMSVSLVILGLWVLLKSLGVQPALQNNNGAIPAFMFAISIGANLILDLACMTATQNSVSSEMSAGRLELLQITEKGLSIFIKSKHAAAQVCTWRVMSIIISMRVGVVLLVLLHTPLLLQTLRLSDLFSLLIIPAFILFALISVAEPFLRSRAICAMGLAVSTQFHNTLVASIVSIGAILWFWLTSTILVVISLTPSIPLFLLTGDFLIFPLPTFVSSLLTSGLVYFLYKNVAIEALEFCLETDLIN